jgi:hypothetical protein
MSNKERIQNTVVCYWADEDEVYVAESAMMPHAVIGIGRTREEAMEDFSRALDSAMDDIEKDNVAGYKIGRPAKGYIHFNTNIRPSSKARIGELSAELKISHGEVVDYLVFYRDCKISEVNLVPHTQSDVAISGLLAGTPYSPGVLESRFEKAFGSLSDLLGDRTCWSPLQGLTGGYSVTIGSKSPEFVSLPAIPQQFNVPSRETAGAA